MCCISPPPTTTASGMTPASRWPSPSSLSSGKRFGSGLADLIEVILPSHVIVAMHADLEATRLQAADNSGERQRDRPRRQNRARENRTRAVHRDGPGAEHLRHEPAISKHPQDCAPRIVRAHRDIK